MSDETPPEPKTTDKIDLAQVVLQRLEGVDRSVRDMRDEARSQRDEVRTQFTKLEGSIEGLKSSDKTLTDAVSGQSHELQSLTARVERLEGDRDTDRRSRSESEHAQTQALEGVAAHIKTVDTHLAAQGRQITALGNNQAHQGKTLEAQTKTLEAQNQQFRVIVSMLKDLARWRSHWAFKALIVVAVFVGASAFGWYAARQQAAIDKPDAATASP